MKEVVKKKIRNENMVGHILHIPDDRKFSSMFEAALCYY